ncbi:transporter substrate-binding domain-containing protein [Desulfarculus baarsii]|nr:transporter substrate-binding domain-containing protein [Desulfarculus baarsii]
MLTLTSLLAAALLIAAWRPAAALADQTSIMVSGDEAYPPYEFNDEQGLPSGFNVEVMSAAARVMGLRASIRLGPWGPVRAQLERGQIDALCGMYYSPARAEKVLFSRPHLVVSFAVFTRHGSDISSLDDARGRTIIVQQGDYADDYVSAAKLGGRVIRVDSPAKALRALVAGQGDCALVARLQGLYLARRLGLGNIAPVGPPVLPRQYCFAVKKGDERLLAALNEGLGVIRASGQYDQIYDKWFGALEEESVWEHMLGHLHWILGPAALIFLLAMAWAWSLRRKVAQRTGELRGELVARRRAEADLQQSQESLRALVDSSSDAILSLDPARHILRCNPAFLRMFGYAEAEALGKSTRILHLSHENFERLGREAYAVIGASGHWLGEVVLQTKDGRELPVELALSAIRDPDGRTTGHVAIIRDISQRRQAEQEKARLEDQLRHAQKMEAIGTLAGGIAHDFNNILGAIMGYAELSLLDAQEGKTSPEKLRNILTSSKRARDLVRQILTFSRKLTPDMRPLRPREVILHALELLRPAIPRMVEIRCRLADDLPLIAGDVTQLEQVLINLASNASDAMPDGGVLTIKAAARQLSPQEAAELALRPGLHVVIAVSDTGHGMDKQTMEQIFDPFFTTKEVGKGTGLGLATAFGVIKAHAGAITCQSEPGRGTVFTLYLPAAEPSR